MEGHDGFAYPAEGHLGSGHRQPRLFSPAPCKTALDEVLAQLTRLGVDVVTLPYEATANGAVQSIPDAELYAQHFKANRDRIDGLVICLPNFGDEIAISELVSRARLNVPILLQARNDEVDRVDVHSRRDAFCGKLSVTNNLAAPPMGTPTTQRQPPGNSTAVTPGPRPCAIWPAAIRASWCG